MPSIEKAAAAKVKKEKAEAAAEAKKLNAEAAAEEAKEKAELSNNKILEKKIESLIKKKKGKKKEVIPMKELNTIIKKIQTKGSGMIGKRKIYKSKRVYISMANNIIIYRKC